MFMNALKVITIAVIVLLLTVGWFMLTGWLIVEVIWPYLLTHGF